MGSTSSTSSASFTSPTNSEEVRAPSCGEEVCATSRGEEASPEQNPRPLVSTLWWPGAGGLVRRELPFEEWQGNRAEATGYPRATDTWKVRRKAMAGTAYGRRRHSMHGMHADMGLNSRFHELHGFHELCELQAP